MEIRISAHEQGYWLSLTKSDREENGWVTIDTRYGKSDELRTQVSVNVQELMAALRAFT